MRGNKRNGLDGNLNYTVKNLNPMGPTSGGIKIRPQPRTSLLITLTHKWPGSTPTES